MIQKYLLLNQQTTDQLHFTGCKTPQFNVKTSFCIYFCSTHAPPGDLYFVILSLKDNSVQRDLHLVASGFQCGLLSKQGIQTVKVDVAN